MRFLEAGPFCTFLSAPAFPTELFPCHVAPTVSIVHTQEGTLGGVPELLNSRHTPMDGELGILGYLKGKPW